MVLPEPTSPCTNRFMIFPEPRSRAISSMVRSCAPVREKGSKDANSHTGNVRICAPGPMSLRRFFRLAKPTDR